MLQIKNNPSHQERSDKLMMLTMMCIWLASSWEEEEKEEEAWLSSLCLFVQEKNSAQLFLQSNT
jgi:hypothetical protein